MDQQITLTLSALEVQDIIKVLGELPTRSGAFPLVVKIDQQLQAQTPKDVPVPPAAAE